MDTFAISRFIILFWAYQGEVGKVGILLEEMPGDLVSLLECGHGWWVVLSLDKYLLCTRRKLLGLIIYYLFQYMITNFITLSTINGEDDEEAEEGVAGADIVILVSNCG